MLLLFSKLLGLYYTQLSYLGAGGWTQVFMLAQGVLHRLRHPPVLKDLFFFNVEFGFP